MNFVTEKNAEFLEKGGLIHDYHNYNALCRSWKTESKVVNFDKLFLRGFWPKGLFTYYVSQKQGFLHPPSPLRQQWSAFG